jgi:hypothetical protein
MALARGPDCEACLTAPLPKAWGLGVSLALVPPDTSQRLRCFPFGVSATA